MLLAMYECWAWRSRFIHALMVALDRKRPPLGFLGGRLPEFDWLYCLSGNLLVATNKPFYTDFAKKKTLSRVGVRPDLWSLFTHPLGISPRSVFGQPHSQGFSFYGKGLGNEVDRFPANQGRRCVKRKWVKFLVEFLVKFLVKLKFSFPIKSPCKQR